MLSAVSVVVMPLLGWARLRVAGGLGPVRLGPTPSKHSPARGCRRRRSSACRSTPPSHLGLYGRGYDRTVDVLARGQYGGEGKGQVAAYHSLGYGLPIRVGGPNAGHKVFRGPKPDTFERLPSGSRCENAGTRGQHQPRGTSSR